MSERVQVPYEIAHPGFHAAMNPNDRYFLNPDYILQGQAVTRAATGSVHLAKSIRCGLDGGLAAISPLALYNQELNRVSIDAQLQKRKLYFSCLVDDFSAWDFEIDVVFLLNGSPVFTWPMFWKTPATRLGLLPANNCLLQPADTVQLPFWVDNQVVRGVGNPPLPVERQIQYPGNTSDFMLPLASCAPLQHPDTLYFQFCTRTIDTATKAQNWTYHTVIMTPTHLDLFAGEIVVNLVNGKFTPYAGLDTPGYLMTAVACVSSRY